MKKHDIARDFLIMAASRGTSFKPPEEWLRVRLPTNPDASDNIGPVAECAAYLCGARPDPEELASFIDWQVKPGGTGFMRREALSKVYTGWVATAIILVRSVADEQADEALYDACTAWLEAFMYYCRACSVPAPHPKAKKFWRGCTVLWPGQRTHDTELSPVEPVFEWLQGNFGWRNSKIARRRCRLNNSMWAPALLYEVGDPGWRPRKLKEPPILWMPVNIHRAEDGSVLVYQVPTKSADFNTNTPPLIVAGAVMKDGKIERIIEHHPHPKKRMQFQKKMTKEERRIQVDFDGRWVRSSAGGGEEESDRWTNGPFSTIECPSILERSQPTYLGEV